MVEGRLARFVTGSAPRQVSGTGKRGTRHGCANGRRALWRSAGRPLAVSRTGALPWDRRVLRPRPSRSICETAAADRRRLTA
ncbi:MAG: hypothetical protein AVDCRST_MAG64-133 [uncultured Phycisphaerae bacterium]|uniref:Uncharacterized protein n=1 Tax=uncultured Phycisphaerae bacterium TaxID=904963 RepID=A0A6J4MZP5_9BACT|nr:MAG: hypothetical protein AVDCRST_MAG64-133 [uncultured Phycisphaerae bacterium]